MAGKPHIIAFVWDFDKTLIPEYMEDPLFAHFQVDGKKFWDEVNHLPEYYRKQGIHHISKDTLYLNHLLTYTQKGIFKNLNNALLRKLGGKIQFNKGIPDFFEKSRQYFAQHPLYQKYNIVIEHYVVSTGLREMILGSKIAPLVQGVWANEFIEDIPQPFYLEKKGKVKKTGILSQTGYIIDNTSKTRALFEIHKGTHLLQNGDVNNFLRDDERRIPFTQMLYIADGPSDIPSYSIINKYGGKSFVVYKPGSQINFMQARELLKQGRVHMLGEANFSEGSQTYLSLLSLTEEIIIDIIKKENPDVSLPQKRLGHIYHGEYVHDEIIESEK